MSNDNEILNRIQNEIDKLDKKDFTFYFFVIDSKNVPNGKLAYTYEMAYSFKELGYNVCMLYSLENELNQRQVKKMKANNAFDKMDEQVFCGVEDWLGKEYGDLPHLNISKENAWSVSPSDFLFIPEAFSEIMRLTYIKHIPCARYVILQNFDYVTDTIPFNIQWSHFGIRDCIAITNLQSEMIKEVMPYVNTKVLNPYIPNYFRKSVEPKKLIVNVISKKQADVKKLIKTFYWKYPVYNFVSFKDVRGMERTHYADTLKEGAITVWIDDETPFGYGALEAMRCDNIVIAKVPDQIQEWMVNSDGELKDNAIWFDNMRSLPDVLANVIGSWMQDEIPEVIYDEMNETNQKYTKAQWDENIKNLVNEIIETRKGEFETIKNIKKNKEKNTTDNNGSEE